MQVRAVCGPLAASSPGVHLQQQRRFCGAITSLQRSCVRVFHRGSTAGGRLVVQANELNKWADRSNYDDHDPENWASSTFDRETANLVLRVLTSKATQRLLHQLHELDLHKAQWFNNYCASHPPSEGNKFLLELFRQPATSVEDVANGTTHTIDPANLAHRIIQIRADMATTMADFPKFAELQNTEVLRSHLMQSTYVTGTSEKGYKERRGYRRSR